MVVALLLAQGVLDDPVALTAVVVTAGAILVGVIRLIGYQDLPPAVVLFLALLATFIGVASLVTNEGEEDGPGSEEPRLGRLACLDEGESEMPFSGTVFRSGVPVRGGPGLTFPTVGKPLPKDCRLNFSGLCLGDVVEDYALGTPDIQWFKLADGPGYVSSARINGNPPPGTQPGDCPGDRPAPERVSLRAPIRPPVGGRGILEATAPHAPIVGFAVFDGQEWRQIEWDDNPSDGFKVRWRPSRFQRARSRHETALTVTAVVCLASGVAYEAQDQEIYPTRASTGRVHRRGSVGDATPPGLATTGRREACNLPQRLRRKAR